MGSSSAPEPDPQIGEAALLSAQTGQEMLAFMQENAKMPQAWAEDDREFYLSNFRDLEQRLAQEATEYDTPERRAAEANKSVATLRQSQDIARQTTERQMAAMGVDPRSGRYQDTVRKQSLANGWPNWAPETPPRRTSRTPATPEWPTR